MEGYYEKVVRNAVGDNIDDEAVLKHAKTIRDRVQIRYALPLIGITFYVITLFVSPVFPYLEKELKLAEEIFHLAVIFPILIGLSALIYGLWFQRRYPRLYLDRKLRELGVRPAMCLFCEYALEGSVSEECPECGAKLAKPVNPQS